MFIPQQLRNHTMKLQKTQKLSKLEQASTSLNQIDDLHQVIGGVVTSVRDPSRTGGTGTTCTDGLGSSLTVANCKHPAIKLQTRRF